MVQISWLTCLHIPSPYLDPKGTLVDKAWVDYQAEVSLNATTPSMINVKRKKKRLVVNMLSGTMAILKLKKHPPPPVRTTILQKVFSNRCSRLLFSN